MDASVVGRAQGLLRELNRVGLFTAADVHVALRLGKLGDETSELVLVAAAFAVRAVRTGSVCVDLLTVGESLVVDGLLGEDAPLPQWDSQAMVDEVQRSVLVVGGDRGPLRPLTLVGTVLYLTRYYQQERVIATLLDARAGRAPAIDGDRAAAAIRALFPANSVPDRQRIATALALTHPTTIIAGGPGTGKTHTVARILEVLGGQPDPPRVALAAPTGKAAARLGESLASDQRAVTLHRLLGWQPGAASFRYNAGRRLPFDVVIVDESSMVSLTMMSRLAEALPDDSRLILVGDPDQLASVDAGAVLADLIARTAVRDSGTARAALAELVGADVAALGDEERNLLGRSVIRLTHNHRFNDTIGGFARAIRAGDAEGAVAMLAAAPTELTLTAPEDLAEVEREVVGHARRVTELAAAGDSWGAVQALEGQRVLCAHREGPFGVSVWAQRMVDWLRLAGIVTSYESWYPGLPLMATANDYDTKIFNGDTGVIVAGGDGEPLAAFGSRDRVTLVHPGMLSSARSSYAMTIHRSQGSQYDEVIVVLPTEQSALLTRELLYTAVTRARHRVRIVGTSDAVRAAISRHVTRASGLR